MINEKLLHQFWSPNIYTYLPSTYKILITNHKKYIFICNDEAYNRMKEKYLNKRKNCLTITKNPNEIEIYLHIDYIKYIIRQRLLTNILNNV